MDDPRNHLFLDYVKFLEAVKPDGFLFENVTGLLNMQGGETFAAVREAFESTMPWVAHAVLSAEEFAIPQRRKRILLLGTKSKSDWHPPIRRTSSPDMVGSLALRPWVSVEEALADLPELEPGQNGEMLRYRTDACTPYQALMRGHITPDEYLESIDHAGRQL